MVKKSPVKTDEGKKIPGAAKKTRKNYIYSVGRRKRSVARVRLFKNGEGKITINDKDFKSYFPYLAFQEIVTAPLEAVGKRGELNFTIKTQGGGVRGQAEAIRHGISRALVELDKDLKNTLKPLRFLTRDSRRKERKKPGLKSARRAPQWQKR